MTTRAWAVVTAGVLAVVMVIAAADPVSDFDGLDVTPITSPTLRGEVPVGAP